jgi:hypothetical protein
MHPQKLWITSWITSGFYYSNMTKQITAGLCLKNRQYYYLIYINMLHDYCFAFHAENFKSGLFVSFTA